MRILLLQSYLGRKENPVFPLGLAYLSVYLNEHEVSILDPNIEDSPFDAIRSRLEGFKPEIIGISLRNVDTTLYRDQFYYYKTLPPTLDIIKELVPSAYIVIGGAAFSLYAESIMLQNPRIDFGVYLEAEESFPELLNHLSEPANVLGIYYRKNGLVLFSGKRSLFAFEKAFSPRRDLFDLSKYHNAIGLGVQSKRGCCLDCAYCTYPFLTGNTLRLRDPAGVVDEIEAINKNLEAFILFADPVFNLPKQHAQAICQEIIKRGIKVKWSAYFSLKGMDEGFIKLAYAAGCRIFICSPDGYSKETLRLLKKEVSIKEVKDTLNLVRQLKLADANFDFSFFINPPGQNYLSFFVLIGLLIKINLFCSTKEFMHISVNIPRLEPHTELHKLAVKERMISGTDILLPADNEFLSSCFYHNPRMQLVTGIYKLLLKIKGVLKNRGS